jgi:hypothetical protein
VRGRRLPLHLGRHHCLELAAGGVSTTSAACASSVCGGEEVGARQTNACALPVLQNAAGCATAQVLLNASPDAVNSHADHNKQPQRNVRK